MSSHTRETGSLRWVGVSHRTLMAWRLLSAIMLLVMGGIHLYLVFDGVGGSLGVLFVLNAVGALVLAIAIIVLRGRLLSLATGLSLLFMVGTLLSLVHTGFKPDQKQNFGGARYGWKMMGGKLVDLLERTP